MHVRLLAILLLALILSFGLAGALVVIQGRLSLSLSACSLPDGLQLRVGQGVAVHCRLYTKAPLSHVELEAGSNSIKHANLPASDSQTWRGGG